MISIFNAKSEVEAKETYEKIIDKYSKKRYADKDKKIKSNNLVLKKY